MRAILFCEYGENRGAGQREEEFKGEHLTEIKISFHQRSTKVYNRWLLS